MSQFYEFTPKDIDNQPVKLSRYKDKVCLVVNVASRCGYTPQYAGLQQLYTEKKSKGFAILAFPCNQFANEEPGTEDEIKTFCKSKYRVGFDLFSKLDVKGKSQAPIYAFLTGRDNPDGSHKIAWNFQKYLIDREGRIIGTYAPEVEPLDSRLVKDIDQALMKGGRSKIREAVT